MADYSKPAFTIIAKAIKDSGIRHARSNSPRFLEALDRGVATFMEQEKIKFPTAINLAILEQLGVPAATIWQLPPEPLSPAGKLVASIARLFEAEPDLMPPNLGIRCKTNSDYSVDPSLPLSHGLNALSCRTRLPPLPGME
jgi:hypothetical protein